MVGDRGAVARRRRPRRPPARRRVRRRPASPELRAWPSELLDELDAIACAVGLDEPTGAAARSSAACPDWPAARAAPRPTADRRARRLARPRRGLPARQAGGEAPARRHPGDRSRPPATGRSAASSPRRAARGGRRPLAVEPAQPPHQPRREHRRHARGRRPQLPAARAAAAGAARARTSPPTTSRRRGSTSCPAGRVFTAERVAYRNLLLGMEPPRDRDVPQPVPRVDRRADPHRRLRLGEPGRPGARRPALALPRTPCSATPATASTARCTPPRSCAAAWSPTSDVTRCWTPGSPRCCRDRLARWRARSTTPWPPRAPRPTSSAVVDELHEALRRPALGARAQQRGPARGRPRPCRRRLHRLDLRRPSRAAGTPTPTAPPSARSPAASPAPARRPRALDRAAAGPAGQQPAPASTASPATSPPAPPPWPREGTTATERPRPRVPDAQTGGPQPSLEGVRVLDVATLFAGPLAATLLGDFGAEVIKVEHPARPDPSRGHGPARTASGCGGRCLGRNKRSVTLDLVAPGGRDAASAAWPPTPTWSSRTSGPARWRRWGLGYDELAAANPRLVLARVTGFGQFGPYARRPGFGTLAEAMSGFAAHHRRAGRAADAAAVRPGRRRSPRWPTAYAVMTALARPRPHRRAARSSTWRSSSRCSPCSARSRSLRPARHRPAAHRQPLGQQRAAQHLPHARRPLGRGLDVARSRSPSG